MGDKITNLTWRWPLISLEWLPEILESINRLLEPSWIGFQREMVANVSNQSFGRRIFSQLQILLKETRLIVENRRYIMPSIIPNRETIIDHLTNLYVNSSDPWANCFRFILAQRIILSSSKLEDNVTTIWDGVYNYLVFKQWTEFFQFIGMGILVDNEKFYPDSAINSNMLNEKHFLERCIKSNNDPRLLIGQHSLHTESDFFAWTKGEDNLPISRDPNLNPRIPHEIIAKEVSTSSIGRINKGVLYWRNKIGNITNRTISFKLNQLIITHKILIDYFLFGKRSYNFDFLTKENTLAIKDIWSSVKSFRINKSIWKIIPKLYNDITKLSFSIFFYRNSLQKIINPWNYYNEDLLNIRSTEEIRSLPIRSYRTKRHLSNYIDNISLINKSLSNLVDLKIDKYYKVNVSYAYRESNSFLPKNIIETEEILADASNIIIIDGADISALKQKLPLNFLYDCPQYPKLATCFWIHRHNEIINHPKLQVIRSIKKKLFQIENKFNMDIAHFNQDMEKWDEASANLRKIIMKLKPIQ